MVKNSDLFKKFMMFSKELRVAACPVPPMPFEGHKPPFPPDFAGPGKPPIGPGFDSKPPFGPGSGFDGKPPIGPGFDGKPPFGAGRPPFGPHGFGKGPGGPMGPGMGRERILVILSDHPEGMRQKALAEEAGINASTTSEMITKLEDTGYVIRTADESDKRATVLKLTDMGAARAEEIRGEREAFMEGFFSKLTEDEKQTLSDLLDKLMEV